MSHLVCTLANDLLHGLVLILRDQEPKRLVGQQGQHRQARHDPERGDVMERFRTTKQKRKKSEEDPMQDDTSVHAQSHDASTARRDELHRPNEARHWRDLSEEAEEDVDHQIAAPGLCDAERESKSHRKHGKENGRELAAFAIGDHGEKHRPGDGSCAAAYLAVAEVGRAVEPEFREQAHGHTAVSGQGAVGPVLARELAYRLTRQAVCEVKSQVRAAPVARLSLENVQQELWPHHKLTHSVNDAETQKQLPSWAAIPKPGQDGGIRGEVSADFVADLRRFQRRFIDGEAEAGVRSPPPFEWCLRKTPEMAGGGDRRATEP